MKNRTLIISATLLSVLLFANGIIRHDVDERKYLALASEPRFDCVGQVRADTTDVGSCVLIRDRFVVTAAHVLIESDYVTETILLEGYKAIVYKPVNQRVIKSNHLKVKLNGEILKVKNIIIYPNYLDSIAKGECDLAILELERPVTTVSPAKLNTFFDEFGKQVIGVGYGQSGIANEPDQAVSTGKKIAGQNTIDSLSGRKINGRETLVLCDFDHPQRKDCNRMGSATPLPLEYICGGGDSGGGLFSDTDGSLLAICSGSQVDMDRYFKTGYYGQIMEWTRLSPFISWIEKYTGK